MEEPTVRHRLHRLTVQLQRGAHHSFHGTISEKEGHQTRRLGSWRRTKRSCPDEHRSGPRAEGFTYVK
ncbi:Aa_trans domain-containing protein [Psidium guajava]|nr:Aa_trans domain-containing protein [Psidium guajava]